MEAIAEDEPKDIEIDYDDTWERFSQKKMIKRCDVLLPNFTYKERNVVICVFLKIIHKYSLK